MGRPIRTLGTERQRKGVPMAKPAFTAQDVRMIAEDRRQLALLRQALAQILGMFTWNEEVGHWIVDPGWQGWIDEMKALRQQQRDHTD
jgi:hypothetical protein